MHEDGLLSLWPQPHHTRPAVSGYMAGVTTRGVLPHTCQPYGFLLKLGAMMCMSLLQTYQDWEVTMSACFIAAWCDVNLYSLQKDSHTIFTVDFVSYFICWLALVQALSVSGYLLSNTCSLMSKMASYGLAIKFSVHCHY